MKNSLALLTAIVVGLGSLPAFAYDTSAPVPIHRTIAKRRVVKVTKQPAAAKPAAGTEKAATSSAK